MLVPADKYAVQHVGQQVVQRTADDGTPVRTEHGRPVAQLVHDGHPDVAADELHDEVIVIDADDGVLLQAVCRILQGRRRLFALFQRCLKDDEGQTLQIRFRGDGGDVPNAVLAHDEQGTGLQQDFQAVQLWQVCHARQAEIQAGFLDGLCDLRRKSSLDTDVDLGIFCLEGSNSIHSHDGYRQGRPHQDIPLQMAVTGSHSGAHALEGLEGRDGPAQQFFAFRSDLKAFFVPVEQDRVELGLQRTQLIADCRGIPVHQLCGPAHAPCFGNIIKAS